MFLSFKILAHSLFVLALAWANNDAPIDNFLPVCNRSPAIRDALVSQLNKNCSEISEIDLNSVLEIEVDGALDPNQKASLTKIDPADFSGLANLESLVLFHVGLKELLPGSFSNLPSLRLLNLARNSLRSWPVGALSDLKNLEILQLSSAGLTTVNPNMFLGLNKLRLLDLSWNQIPAVDVFSFSDLTSLETLDLTNVNSHTRGKTIPPALYFQGGSKLPSLRELLIGQNGLKQVPQNLGLAFPNLMLISLESNLIEKIDIVSFETLPFLRKIYAQNNSISVLSETAFRNNSALAEIDFTGNHLRTLPLNSFLGLQELSVLRLGRNNLVGLPPGIFLDLKKIDYLGLDNNQIRFFGPGISQGLKSLKHLNLEKNRLSVAPRALSENLPNLKVFWIGHNPLTNFALEILDIPTLEIVDLYENSLTDEQKAALKKKADDRKIDLRLVD